MNGSTITVAVFILLFEIGFCTFDFITTGSFYQTLNQNTSTNLGDGKGFEKTELELY